MTIDPEVAKANLEADPGYRYVCRICGKTPEVPGWCDKCGYNRPYEKIELKKH